MTPFFHAHDLTYGWIGLTLVLLDRLVLVRVLRPATWYWLRLPAVILHEAAHFLVALLLLAWPRVHSLTPTPLPDGSVRLGRVEWGPPLLGELGNGLAKLAPIAWFFVAGIAADHMLAQPHGLLEGLGWVLALWVMLEAGLLLSEDDLDGLGLLTGLAFLLFGGLALLNAFTHARLLLCHAVGLACGPF